MLCLSAFLVNLDAFLMDCSVASHKYCCSTVSTGLLSTMTSTLACCWLPAPALDFLTARLFRNPYRKERLIELHFIRQLVYGIPLSHDVPQLHHHKPHGRVLFYPQLVLDFFCGKHLLDGRHKVHGIEPSTKGQLAVFHYRPLGQGNAATAFCTLKRFSPLQPLISFDTAIRAGNALDDANVSKIRHAGFFRRKTTFKLT